MSQKPEKRIRLSPLDKRILNRLQEGIPFEPRPWAAIADELNIKEEALLRKIAALKKTGVIRRISAVFSPRKVDFVSTLAAAKAAPGKVGPAAKAINSFPEVTHNYRRSGPYDLWFAMVAKNRKKITDIMRKLERNASIDKLAEFPAVNTYKIRVKFPI